MRAKTAEVARVEANNLSLFGSRFWRRVKTTVELEHREMSSLRMQHVSPADVSDPAF